ncbi:MAG: 3-isopropylmalate dehydratase [Candidatus Marinimicrobia bacterium]|nr:3-isopropylmalate dehydratase [Candidatus Neomarinimicrobiota bacterium]MCF7830022.1 3-isopropylmalate dehydratase [Candidatus Neomarinimicrobiota bacterium]MCF7881936.1 3-isopropylmalate dehydratase [Candidatus Neomarinimicrobiota bacterium]
MENVIEGKIWKYGDDVNTDVIFPGKYTYTISDPSEMAKHALEDLDPDFAENVNAGDIIVGGSNWGNGSSREQAVTCLKEAGVGAIIAKSFARIYYRNCINNALPAITCPDLVDNVEEGDTIAVHLKDGVIRANDREFRFPAFPVSVVEIFNAGGLLPYTRERLARE